MEDLNIKLLSALKSLMPFIDADIDRGIRNDNRHGGLEYRARNAKAVILEAEHTIAAAEQAQQAEPVAWFYSDNFDKQDNLYRRTTVRDVAEGFARQGRRVIAQYDAAQPPAVAVPQAASEGCTCKECGSTNLTWHTSNVIRSSVQQGRLNTNDVECLFYLGCDDCSETLMTLRADKVAGMLGSMATAQKGGAQ